MDSAARTVVIAVEAALLVAILVVAAWLSARADVGPNGPDYVDIADVPDAPASDAATGTYSWDCGRNENGHRNSANIVVAPNMPVGEHHAHEYVGNLSTDADSTEASLAAAGTTCGNGDLSTYYWPVLHTADGGPSGQGEIQTPAAVTLTFHGSPAGPVVGMPRFLRGAVGNARAITDPAVAASPTWTCSGTPQRRTDRYPRCPDGDRIVRVFDFPSCWDGRRVDSPNHRAHLVFPGPDGACPHRTFAVPRLRLTVAYALPPGARYVIDSFPAQRKSPRTDHAFFVNIIPQPLMAEIVRCLNAGSTCGRKSE